MPMSLNGKDVYLLVIKNIAQGAFIPKLIKCFMFNSLGILT